MTLSFFDGFIVFAVLAATLFIGFRHRRAAGQSLEEYFLAGRKFGWFLAGTSMAATLFAVDTPLAVSGIVGQPGQANYAASKAGIIGFTKSLAKELGSRNITVNAVAPGFVLTDLTADLSEDLVQKALEFIPLGRWGELQEIANVVTFLASDKASYITGEVIQVDGGIAI